MGYHSFRNIGYRLTDSEAACTKWREKYAGFDPSHAAAVLQLSTDDTYVYVTYFGLRYRLRCRDGVLEKAVPVKDAPEKYAADKAATENAAPEKDGQLPSGKEEQAAAGQPEVWTEDLFMNEALVLYHLLGDVKDNPRQTGRWCSEADLDPVRIRSGNRTDPLLNGFASDFSGKIPLLEAAAQRLGGVRIEKGDSSWEFRPIPQIALRLIFWDADDEFPAQVQVMVDSGVTDYMHYEAVGCMIADLFEWLGGGEMAAGGAAQDRDPLKTDGVKFPVS